MNSVIQKENPFFISSQELSANLSEYKIVDASWYLPAQKRDGKAEYEAARIPNAVFFDIDAISDSSSSLPHMLPSPESFAKTIGALGIHEKDDIVIYDGVGLFSAARAWWTFGIMGAKNVRILQGGFDRWQEVGLETDTNEPAKPVPSIFTPNFNAGKVSSFENTLGRVKDKNSAILDARPNARWLGQEKEPRAGLRSGHMPGSFSLPINELVEDGSLIDVEQLKTKFLELKVTSNTHITTSCGSGVTAAIISLALDSIGHENHTLYDGSWAEWGSRDDAPVIEWQS